MKDLPRFTPYRRDYVESLIKRVLSKGEEDFFYSLTEYDDGHYRAEFETAYFGDTPPSKSQWNTLKKRLKRHNEKIFVFKEQGETPEGKLYLDFGFFAE